MAKKKFGAGFTPAAAPATSALSKQEVKKRLAALKIATPQQAPPVPEASELSSSAIVPKPVQYPGETNVKFKERQKKYMVRRLCLLSCFF